MAKLMILLTLTLSFIFLANSQLDLYNSLNSQFIQDLQKCAENQCTQEWSQCQAKDSCVEALLYCVDTCQRNVTCWVICLGDSKSKDAIAVGLCGYSSNCLRLTDKKIKKLFVNVQACTRDNCPAEWDQCQIDQYCLPAIKGCTRKCESDRSCWDSCLPTKNNQAATNGMVCAFQNNCLDYNQQQTQQQEQGQWQTQGEKLAQQVQEQAQAQEQKQILKQQSSISGFPDLSTLKPEYVKVSQCAAEKCPKQWDECIKDSNCIPSILDCLNQCNTQPTCWLSCLPQKKNAAAISGALCAYSNQCLDTIVAQNNSSNKNITELSNLPPQFMQVKNCAQQKCPQQWKKCMAEKKCLPAILDCLNKCSKNQTCWLSCLPAKGSSEALNGALCAYSKNCLSKIQTSSSSSAATTTNTLSSANIPERVPLMAPAFQYPQPYPSPPDITAVIPKLLKCVEDSCPIQWKDCIKDPKCLISVQECLTKCEKAEDCWMPCLGGKRSIPAILISFCTYEKKCLQYL